jgi:hypothetical protein
VERLPRKRRKRRKRKPPSGIRVETKEKVRVKSGREGETNLLHRYELTSKLPQTR